MKLGGEWDGFSAVPAEFVAQGDTGGEAAGNRRSPPAPPAIAYCAVAVALVLGALSWSMPGSKTPLPLQSIHAVTT